MKFGFLALLWFFSSGAVAANVDNINVFAWPDDGSNVIGEIQHTQVLQGQTLLDIAETYGLGYMDIVTANPDLDPWLPALGAKVMLPTQYVLPQGLRRGVVINLAEYRLYHFVTEMNQIRTYPVGIGRENTPTPTGSMEVTARIANPTWYPPASIREQWAREGRAVKRQIPAGPDNPLGPFAISLSKAGYLIHGTNQGFGIGTRTSAGCIRMNNKDIEALVKATHIGVPVSIVNQPFKVGLQNQHWLLEVHDPATLHSEASSHTAMVHALITARRHWAGQSTISPIDWDKADHAFKLKQGIPVAVGANMDHHQGAPE